MHCSLLHFRPLPLPDYLFAFLPPPSPSPSRFLHSSHFVSFPLFFISSPSLLSLITFLTIIFPVCPAPFPVPSYSFTILNLFPCHYLPYLFLPVYRLSLPSTLLLPSLLPPFRFLSFFLASNLLPFLFCFPPFSLNYAFPPSSFPPLSPFSRKGWSGASMACCRYCSGLASLVMLRRSFLEEREATQL